MSQFATTLFNAAFFAGLDFGEYQSHSIYISRYPQGPRGDDVVPQPRPGDREHDAVRRADLADVHRLVDHGAPVLHARTSTWPPGRPATSRPGNCTRVDDSPAPARTSTGGSSRLRLRHLPPRRGHQLLTCRSRFRFRSPVLLAGSRFGSHSRSCFCSRSRSTFRCSGSTFRRCGPEFRTISSNRHASRDRRCRPTTPPHTVVGQTDPNSDDLSQPTTPPATGAATPRRRPAPLLVKTDPNFGRSDPARTPPPRTAVRCGSECHTPGG